MPSSCSGPSIKKGDAEFCSGSASKCPDKEFKELTKNIKIEGSDKFKKKTEEALREIAATDSGKELLKSLKSEVTIKETSKGNAYYPSSDTVVFNTKKKQVYDGSEKWMKRPPSVALAHELVHASHDQNGGIAKKKDGSIDIKNEELRTVGLPPFEKEPFSENSIRKEMGEPKRPRYGGTKGDW